MGPWGGHSHELRSCPHPRQSLLHQMNHRRTSDAGTAVHTRMIAIGIGTTGRPDCREIRDFRSTTTRTDARERRSPHSANRRPGRLLTRPCVSSPSLDLHFDEAWAIPASRSRGIVPHMADSPPREEPASAPCR